MIRDCAPLCCIPKHALPVTSKSHRQQHLLPLHPRLNHPHSSPLPFTTGTHMAVHVTTIMCLLGAPELSMSNSRTQLPPIGLVLAPAGTSTPPRHNVHAVLRKRIECAIPTQRHNTVKRLARTSSQPLTLTACMHMLFRQMHLLSQAKDARNPYLHTRCQGPHSKGPTGLAPQQQPHGGQLPQWEHAGRTRRSHRHIRMARVRTKSYPALAAPRKPCASREQAGTIQCIRFHKSKITPL